MRNILEVSLVGQRKAGTTLAIGAGLLMAAIAILLRLAVSADVGGEQALFAYPAVVVATLLIGARAGVTTAIVCLLALWYYVLPVQHSFELAGPREFVTVTLVAGVAAALIWAVSSMRGALRKYVDLSLQLEARVEERTAERNRFWDLSQELVGIVDGEGNLLSHNPAFARLLPDQPSMSSFVELLVPGDREAFSTARSSLENGIKGTSFNARLGGNKNVHRVAWNMVLDGHLFYLIGRDFTAEYNIERQLVQSQKMELVGQINGGLAHDFGNALTSISIALHLLKHSRASDQSFQTTLETAEQAVTMGEAAVKRLLLFSRPSDEALEITSVAMLLEGAEPLLRQFLDGRMLTIVTGDTPLLVRVVRDQFDMALLNLAINARDATPDGGNVSIRTEARGEGFIDLIVADDGMGMDSETIDHALEPFFTTKGVGDGTGLGLAMVNQFAISAGGKLTIESSLGHGTRMRLSLPIVSSANV
jgi:signal transduction histidine kinase